MISLIQKLIINTEKHLNHKICIPKHHQMAQQELLKILIR